MDDIVFEMNIMLYAKEFDKMKFLELLKEVREKYHPKIGMLDFKYFNKLRRKELWDKKVNAVRNLDFEKAASYREQEKLCLALIDSKKRFKIKKSIFRIEENYLIYLYIGNARNDLLVKKNFASENKR